MQTFNLDSFYPKSVTIRFSSITRIIKNSAYKVPLKVDPKAPETSMFWTGFCSTLECFLNVFSHNKVYTGCIYGISLTITSMKSTHECVPFKHSVVRLYIAALC